jgi:hypothetical protein
MHCCADEAVAPASDTAAALSATPPTNASAIANFVTVVLMFLLQFFFVPARKMALRPLRAMHNFLRFP